MKFISIKKINIYITCIIILLSSIVFILHKIYTNNKIINSNITRTITIDSNIKNKTKVAELKNNEIDYNFLKQKYDEKKILALTFDDGPSKYTKELVDILNKNNINATFFLLGESIEKYPNILKYEINSGNEIGIHSYKHKLFTKLNSNQIKEQIDSTRKIIMDVQQLELHLTRVPYGAINKNVQKVIDEENLQNVLWDVDSLDWKFKNTQKTYNYMLKKIKGNDIILMHDSFKTSIETASLIINHYTNEGYVFVKVSTLLKLRNL